MSKRKRRATRRRRPRTEEKPIPEGPPPEAVAPQTIDGIPEMDDLEAPDADVRQAIQEEINRLDDQQNGHGPDPYDEQVRASTLNMSQAIYLKLVEITHMDDPLSDLAVDHYEQLADTSLAAAQIYMRRMGFMNFEGDPRAEPDG